MGKLQLDMFAQIDDAPSQPISYAPNAERIRLRIGKIMEQLAGSETLPWDKKTMRFHKMVFPQMVSVLPPEEAQQYQDAFERELKRFE